MMLNQAKPNTRMYESSELGGFTDIFKAVGQIASSAASIFKGGSSSGSSSNSSATQAQLAQAVGQFNSAFDGILSDLNAGNITGQAGLDAVQAVYQQWATFKFSVPTGAPQGYLYNTGELQVLKPKWESVEARARQLITNPIVPVQQATGTTTTNTTGTTTTTTTAQQSQIISGIDNTYLFIGGAVLGYMFLKK